jgi:excisionase family DNA binding protein
MSQNVTLDRILDAIAAVVASKLAAREVSRTAADVAPRLLTVKQAAAYLGRTEEAIQHMVAARKLPVVRDGRRVFLDVRELDKWIERNREPAES